MKKTLSLLLLLSLVLSLASCGQKTTTDDPVAAATLAESYQSYLDTAEPSYAYDIALELTTNPEYFNAEQGGRNAGSDAEHAAADYLVGVMKDIGLADVEKQAAQCDRWQFNSASLTIDGKDYNVYTYATASTPAEGLTAGTPAAPAYATVRTPDGGPVKLRKSARKAENVYWLVNHGARVQVERRKGEWALVTAICADGHTRRAWMMSVYLAEK